MSEDLEMKQLNRKLKRLLWILSLPLVVFAVLFVRHRNNDLEYITKRYELKRNQEFYGTVISKKQDSDYPRASRYVYIQKNRAIGVSKESYLAINIGDSVAKMKGKDSVYFYLHYGGVVYQDINRMEREDYFKLLKKKQIEAK